MFYNNTGTSLHTRYEIDMNTLNISALLDDKYDECHGESSLGARQLPGYYISR